MVCGCAARPLKDSAKFSVGPSGCYLYAYAARVRKLYQPHRGRFLISMAGLLLRALTGHASIEHAQES